MNLLENVSEQPELPSPFDDGGLYDLLFENFDYGLEFYLELAQAAGGPVLDIACGTGRILLPCLKAGVDVDGLDLSPALLERLKFKAQQLGFQPTLYQADMRSFQCQRQYKLQVIPFNAIVHLLTTDDQLTALRRCYDHLELGGNLVFDTFFPGMGILNLPQHSRQFEHEIQHPQTGLPVRLYDTRSFDRVEQIQYSLMEIEELDAQGNVAQLHRCQTTVRWIYKSEMELLLRLAGFQRWEIYGGFDRRPLKNETDAMIVSAWRE